MKKLKENFIDIVNDYMNAWCEKHGYDYEEDMWVGNDYGGVCAVGDLFVSFDDVRYDIDNDLPEKTFEDWYWYSLDIAELGCERIVNLKSYSMGCRPYTDEQLDNIREAKKNVEESKRILEYLIKNSKPND